MIVVTGALCVTGDCDRIPNETAILGSSRRRKISRERERERRGEDGQKDMSGQASYRNSLSGDLPPLVRPEDALHAIYDGHAIESIYMIIIVTLHDAAAYKLF